jgi:large subunit ribosomal protein L13
MIIDATNLKLGGISTLAAKAALKGETIDIVNCEKAVITGSKTDIVSKYQARRARGGPHWGPFINRRADHFVRRTIRGMLPYKTPRGSEAYKRIMCFIGNPNDLDAQTIKQADITTSQTMKYMTVGQLCVLLGGKQS